MTQITLKGNPINLEGSLPEPGQKVPDFKLVDAGLADRSLADYAGKTLVMTINPSLDTGLCAMAARAFNERAAGREDTVVLVITADLPFAQKRFCTAEGIEDAITLSMMRGKRFAKDFGLLIADGPMAGLLARAVLVVDGEGVLQYLQLVPEIAQEPDYDAAMAALNA